MEIISGYIKRIIFSNKENGYTVFELTTDTEDITCVGALHAVSDGETIKLSGGYVNHSVYGRQFAFESYETVTAEDETDILRYLSSGAVKGIGPTLAKRIVDAFSTDTFRVMEEEPELLSRIKGISLAKAQEIGSYVAEKQELRKVMLFLQKFGVSNNLAGKIYKRYGDGIFEIINENPYRLAEDIEGVGFLTADRIAESAGVVRDSAYRVASGISYTLSSAASEGHVFLPKEELISRASELLSVDKESVETECDNLIMDKKIIVKITDGERRVYLSSFYRMEVSCAGMLIELDMTLDPDTEKIRNGISRFEDIDSPLEDKQKDAVVSSVSNAVSIITGGPGTGKTTIINVLIKYLMSRGEDIVLAAPTGRAAKRMTEATGYESSTIQRLLGLIPQGEDGRRFTYEYNEDNPLEADTVIIDEMSMVDLPLLRALLCAMVPGMRLIMVGDTNQLPSVGPGAVLKDIIASGCFKTAKLDRIYRQSEASDIILNAHRINEGIMPKLDNKSNDFFMMRRDEIDPILKNTVLLVSEKLPKYVNAQPFDVQVLTPMRKGPLGVESLNPILQRYLNPPSANKREKEYGNTLFREGDKVMQIRNDYQLEWEVTGRYGIVAQKGVGVFNGDMGTIRTIDTYSETVEVVYEEERVVRYPFSGLDELELAYAVTIHKSQGSEYPAVVIPLLTGPRQLFNRNLLYTAVTRARKCVTIIGSEQTVAKMVENADELKRYTGLKDAIIEISQI